MKAPAAGFLFLLGADWSGALVRPGVAGPWRLVPSHTTALGLWEVHSDVGLVGAGEDTLWGVLSLVGGMG
jgi:hypothetical protein